jgi:hypothetical protein
VPSTLLKPQNAEFVIESIDTRQSKQKRKFDRHAPGENVMIQHKENWTHGSVVEKHEMPRSYVVETNNGKKVSQKQTLPEIYKISSR